MINVDHEILDRLQPGMHLIFAGAGEREIQAINEYTIYLDGSALDPVNDGWPNSVRFVERESPSL